MEKSQECHLTAVKRVLRYINDTIDHDVFMSWQKNISTKEEVHGYTNSDLSGYQDEKKCSVCYLFMIGIAPISWSSRKKNIVALSSYEDEYVVASYAACQTLCINKHVMM